VKNFVQCMSRLVEHRYRRQRVEFIVAIGGAADMDGNAAATRCVENDPQETCAAWIAAAQSDQ
jgi:hypothetical protein